MSTRKLLVAMGASLIPAMGLASEWEIDSPHSSVQFSVRHMMISNVKGEFDKVIGTISVDDKNIALSSVKAEIDATTISTREPKRDEHLKSADFLNVEKFPKITFVSKKITKSGKNKLKVTGDFTLHGVTQEVVLDVVLTDEVKDPWGGVRRGAEATAVVKRKDHGVSFNKTMDKGGVMIGEDVHVEIDLELVRKDSATP